MKISSLKSSELLHSVVKQRIVMHVLMFILVGKRNVNMESLYDYGSRAGFCRVSRITGA